MTGFDSTSADLLSYMKHYMVVDLKSCREIAIMENKFPYAFGYRFVAALDNLPRTFRYHATCYSLGELEELLTS